MNSWDLSRFSRRGVLLAGGTSLVAYTLSGCSALSTSPSGTEISSGASVDDGLREAPGLAAKVEAGELPPLADRLPAAPLVVQPVERTGTYGGTWGSVVLGPSDTVWIQNTIGYEGLLRWNLEWTGTVPNVAESVEASADAREFTIALRQGIRWSDGEPLTADDLVFAFEDVLMNPELSPVTSSWLVSGEEPATLEKIDDFTVRLRYAEPNGMFLDNLATVGNAEELVDKPRHYLEEFHADYNSSVKKLAKKEGFASWTELFAARMGEVENPDKPTLNAWLITTPIGEGSRVEAERNPYYWKTDPDGRQLPYIDKIVYEVVSDPEVILLKATDGEFDLIARHVNSLPNKPVLAKSRESGGYKFIDLRLSTMNEMIVSLNLCHQDPVKRKIFGNKDFRIGLSHAVNRSELIDAAFQRQGEPWQAAPNPESEFYDEEMAKQFTDYDVTLAQEYLDKVVPDKDAKGFRLRPDGKRLRIVVEVPTPALIPFWVDAMDLVAGYWKAVGVETTVKAEDRTLYGERTTANVHDAGVWNGTGGFGDEILGPLYYLPSRTSLVAWATPWSEWFLTRGQGKDAEKPPAAPLQQMELYWQLTETPDEAGRNELFRQILQIAKDEFYTIGTVRIPQGYGTVSNRMHNVPPVMVDSYRYGTPAPTNPSQYFLD